MFSVFKFAFLFYSLLVISSFIGLRLVNAQTPGTKGDKGDKGKT